MNSDLAPPPTPEEIAVCAYLIWEHEGRPEGHAMQHWLQAETQLIAAHHHEQLLKPVREPRSSGES
jgi:hypothetical protein